MASAVKCFWVSLFLLSVHSGCTGVSGRAVDALGYPRRTGDKPFVPPLRTRRRREGTQNTRRDRCAELGAVWMENVQQAEEDKAMVLQLRGRPLSPTGASQGLLFPGRPLFNFVRKVYQCCQEGGVCSSVKGIQGRMRGDRDVEFLLSREVLSLAVTRAELHLQIFNPLHLDVRPMLRSRAEGSLPTRFSLWSEGTRVELRVELLFHLRSLPEAAGGVSGGGGHSMLNMRWMALSSSEGPLIQKPASLALQEARGHTSGDGVLTKLPDQELGLVLSCCRDGAVVSCGSSGVQLSHTPFIALYYT